MQSKDKRLKHAFNKELIAFVVPVVWPNCMFGPNPFESALVVPKNKFQLQYWSLAPHDVISPPLVTPRVMHVRAFLVILPH